MSRLTIDPGGTRFLRDGRPTFLLADTVWAAFTRPLRMVSTFRHSGSPSAIRRGVRIIVFADAAMR